MGHRYGVVLLVWSLVAACSSNKSSSDNPAPAAGNGQSVDGTTTQNPNSSNPGTSTSNPGTSTNNPGTTGNQTGSTAAVPCSGCNAVVIADSVGQGLFARYPYQAPVPTADAVNLANIILQSGTSDQLKSRLAGNPQFSAQNYSGYDGTGGSENPAFKSFLSQLGISNNNIKDVSLIGATVAANGISELQQAQNQLGSAASNQVSVLVLALGNNDFCDTLSESMASYGARFQQTYLQTLQAAGTDFAHSTIYAVSPINVPNLQAVTAQGNIIFQGNIGSLISILSTYTGSATGNSVTCKTLQSQYCPELFSADAADKYRTMITAMQQAVQSYANSQSAQARKVYFADLSSISYTTDMLATDCFHPSIKGQQMLANSIMAQAKLVTPNQ